MKDGGAEFFPKPSNNEVWLSQLRGPLGVHLKAEAKRGIGWFEGPPKDIEHQLVWLGEQPLNSAKSLNALLNALHDEEKRQEALAFKIVQAPRKSNGNFHILDYVQTRPAGDHLIARCPLCAAEGRDTSKDNLHIANDGTWFGCWQGFWNEVHTPKMIYRYLVHGSL